MQVEQRLLKYVSYWTTSDENNMADGKIQIPSTGRQFDLGKVLEQELRDLGLKNVILTDHCYVYGLLPATAGCEGHKAVGFISHMDTAPDYSGKDVKPQIIPDYDGGDVRLNGTGAMLNAQTDDVQGLLKVMLYSWILAKIVGWISKKLQMRKTIK